jgi:hypothetical protein
MKSLQTSLLLVLGVVLAAPVIAQTDASAPSSGLLGKRYVEAFTTLSDYKNFEDNDFTLGTSVNIPLTTGLDAGAYFQHTWTEGDQSENFQDLAANLTAYASCGALRPFVRATLGYDWWYVSNDPFYQIDVGGEYLVTQRFSVSVQLSWSEFLASDWNGGGFSGSTRANYWVTEAIATSLTMGYLEGGSWSYGLAAVFRF